MSLRHNTHGVLPEATHPTYITWVVVEILYFTGEKLVFTIGPSFDGGRFAVLRVMRVQRWQKWKVLPSWVRKAGVREGQGGRE